MFRMLFKAPPSPRLLCFLIEISIKQHLLKHIFQINTFDISFTMGWFSGKSFLLSQYLETRKSGPVLTFISAIS